MVRTQIQLNESQMKALKALSADRNRSLSELIRQAVDELLHHSSSADRQQRLRRAIAAAGRFRSGVPDLATEHDRYLVEGDPQ